MKRPAVFFDRDNTLIVSDGYLGDPAKVVLIQGAADALARLRKLGFVIVVVSNQSGIARGMFDEAATQAVNARLEELLRQANPGAIIDTHEYCPHHPEAPLEKYRVDCECRKPKPGMIRKAAADLDLDLPASWLIGDAPRDVEAGRAAGCRTVLFIDPALAASPAATERPKYQPDFRVSSLKEAADIIEAHVKGSILNQSPTPADDLATARAVVTGGVPQSSTRIIQPAVPAMPGDPLLLEQLRKLNNSSEAILALLRRQVSEQGEFSGTRLAAFAAQALVFAAMFIAYIERSNPQTLQSVLLWAILLQLLSIAMTFWKRR